MLAQDKRSAVLGKRYSPLQISITRPVSPTPNPCDTIDTRHPLHENLSSLRQVMAEPPHQLSRRRRNPH